MSRTKKIITIWPSKQADIIAEIEWYYKILEKTAKNRYKKGTAKAPKHVAFGKRGKKLI